MSSADGSADYVPEAEASAGKGEVGMESSVSNSEVQVVSASLSMVDFKPQRWQASRPVNSSKKKIQSPFLHAVFRYLAGPCLSRRRVTQLTVSSTAQIVILFRLAVLLFSTEPYTSTLG